MISIDDAWRTILDYAHPLPVISQSVPDAVGSVLAEAVTSDRDLPPADRSAMDGYAIQAKDLDTVPTELQLIGEVAAGSDATPRVEPRTCASIYTGANLPPGADTVVMIEDTERVRDAGVVTFQKTIPMGKNIFRQGENARKGDTLILPGTRVTAAHVAVLATVGATTLSVHRKPTVSILTTGKELREANEAVGKHQTRNSNGPMLAALLATQGYNLSFQGTVPDDLDRTINTIQAALKESDVTVITGGVSVGRYDLVPAAIEAAGGVIRYHGINMKPGKPQLFATTDDGHLIFGLPGNPLSTLIGFCEFTLPALHRLAGLPADHCRSAIHARLADDVPARNGRRRFVIGNLTWTAAGPEVTPIPTTGSADLVAAGKANGAIVMPIDTGLAAGEIVEFRPWRAIS